MFTQASIALGALERPCGFRLSRDAAVRFAGKLPTPLEGRVVPAVQPFHVEAAIAAHAEDPGGIAALIVPAALAEIVPEYFGLGLSETPQATVGRIQEYLAGLKDFQWRSFESRVDPTVEIAPGAFVADHDVIIGAGSYVGPNAVVLPRTVIGAQSYVGAGTVVGMEAFEKMAGANPVRILPQSGGVKIADNVTIQAKCTIVRATFGGFTTIGTGTTLDCQIHVAHDCRIGERVTLTACTEVSGRVDIGDDSFLGPNCAISNGVRLGKGVHVTIGSVVVKDVPDGERVTGNFALPHKKWLNFIRAYR